MLGAMSALATASVFLDLLARDAAAIEYDGPVVAARVAGAGAEELAELEAAKRVALGVRATLARSRRREAELVALFETAGDLAALRDLGAVLKAIVTRAHTLIGADVTYLTLDDPDRGDTYMRVTHGSVSARFQSLRLPMGAGLGGLVAQTAKPYVTSDYPRDARFRHTNEIDEGVGEEGLTAILGVPLVLGSRVIGVLFAANRSARPFARHEITLLASLAAHAAVAIDNARLLQATRDALGELRSANELVRAHSEAVERAAAVHDKLADLVLRGGDVEGIAAAVAEALGGGLVVVDADGVVTAVAGEAAGPDAFGEGLGEGMSPAIGTPLGGTADLITLSAATGHAVRSGDLVVAAVAAAAEPLGALILRVPETFGDVDQRILERAALVVALHLLMRRSEAEAAERLGGDLLDDLLAVPVRHTSTLVERARRVGVDLDRPHIIVAADAAPADRSRAHFAAGRLAKSEGGLAGSHEGRIVLLLPGDDPSATAQRVLSALRGGLAHPVTVGAGGPKSEVTAYADAHAEAVRCLGALHALGRDGCAASPSDLGFLALVLGGGDPGDVVRKALGPLVDYDAKRGTDLLGTVEQYFACGRSLGRTGEALHIHVNTVTQRLDRTARLLGADWQEPGRSLEIQLALQIRRVMGL
ncbi:putative phytochrome sensor protein [Catenulispora acidiphila DSM 44928]|uniref:Putative phytochrome sensor protein n=2 Tax=Catenulispora TaxID=414878 RepID=C7QFG1_CATAD|nr:putative phytochrome sensor protein [Catenulispora acidiphila DSM 44928]